MTDHAKAKRRIGLFYQYILSYLSVVAIVLGVLAFLILGVFIRDFAGEAKANNTDKLTQLEQMTDVELSGILQTLVTRVALDSALTPVEITRNRNTMYNVVRVLNDYRDGNQFVFDIGLVFSGDLHVYTGSGIYPLRTFFSHHYRYSGVDSRSLFRAAQNATRPEVFPASSVETANGLAMNFLTYVFPVQLAAYNYLHIIVLIDTAPLRDTMGTFVASSVGYLLLADRAGRVLYERQSPSLPALPAARLVPVMKKLNAYALRARTPFLRNLKIDRVAYTATYLNSNIRGLVYVFLSPVAAYTRSIRAITRLFVSAIAGMFLLAVVLAVFFSRRSYRALRRISDKVAAPAVRGRGFLASTTELETIDERVDKMLEENRDLAVQLSQDLPIVREQLLYRILDGQTSGDGAVIEKAARVGIDLHGNAYVTIYVILDAPSESSTHAVMHRLERRALSSGKGYAVRRSDDQIVFLFCIRRGHAEEVVRLYAEEMRSYFAANHGVMLTLAVGRIYSTPDNITDSYNEARAAALHRFQLGKNRVIYHRDIAPSHDIPVYLVLKNRPRIESLIRRGDYAQLKEACSNVLAGIRRERLPIEIATYLANSLLDSILRVVEELTLPLLDFVRSTGESRILLVGQFETIDDFENYLLLLCKHLCERVNARTIGRNISLRENLAEYIEKNYTDPQISLKYLAGVFHVSPSYLSRFFRRQFGESIMGYIDKKRLTLCKSLLSQTELHVRDVIVRAGYCDSANFVRKFRRVTGVTPIQFRKATARASSNEGLSPADLSRAAGHPVEDDLADSGVAGRADCSP